MLFFFFQAEDGIRDKLVTGVQTCALPISTLLCASFFPGKSSAQTPTSPVCRIESKNFEGWRAEEMSNPWINVVIVPQLGGRVMQVTFGGHAYLLDRKSTRLNSSH